MRHVFYSLCFVLFACAHTSVAAQIVDPDALEQLERDRIKANQDAEALRSQKDKLNSEISNLKTDLITIAAEAESYEKESQNLEIKITNLTASSAKLRQDIIKDETAFNEIFAALQRIETSPPPAIVGNAKTVTEAVQASQLMSGLARSLRLRANALSAQLQHLEDTESQAIREKQRLSNNETALSKKRATMEGLVAQKTKLEKSVSTQSAEQARRAKQLAADADSLRDLIAKIERAAKDVAPRVKPERPRPSRDSDATGLPRTYPRIKPDIGRAPEPLVLPPDTQRFADARGHIRSPVSGSLKKGYSKDHSGLTVTTRSKAQVLAPYSGRVEFAGPFKNYDNVVILNVGGGYFILLTGLGENFVSTGENVSSGEPLGRMPNDGANRTELYIELRQNGSPINPQPWLGTAFASRG